MRTAFLLFALFAFSRHARADSYLIAVGSNAGFAGEPVLRYAERDALAIRDVLKQLGAHERLHETMLLGADAPQLVRALSRLTLTSDDSLYVYYSGHANRDGLHLGAELLPFDSLAKLIDATPARIKLLMIDACRAGEITRNKGARPAPAFVIALEDSALVAGTAIVTSSADSEDSQESDDLQGSFFTFHFVQGLRGAADRDGDRRVTLSEAFGYASRQTLRSTALTQQLQHPTFRGKLFGRSTEVVLSRLDVPRASSVIVFRESGNYLIFDERDELFAEISIDNASTRYFIPAGKWLLQRRRGEGAEEQIVELRAGEELEFSARAARTVSLTRLEAKGRANYGTEHRLHILGGASAVMLDGHAALPAVWVGYRRRLSQWEAIGEARLASDNDVDDVVGLRAHVDHGTDIGRFRFGGGLTVQADFHHQRAPTSLRQLYLGVGLLAFLEVRVAGPISFRVEGGPSLHLLKLREEGRASVSVPPGWWVASGPGWGF